MKVLSLQPWCDKHGELFPAAVMLLVDEGGWRISTSIDVDAARTLASELLRVAAEAEALPVRKVVVP